MFSVKESNVLQKRNRMPCFNGKTVPYNKLGSSYLCLSKFEFCFRKEKVSVSGEQEGIPVHFQRALRESSEEAGIMNNV